MTPLARILARRIRVEGPISVSTFMAEALGHPEHGYYRSTDPLGASGDFVTAPEISQMFGELIGLWCAEMWRLMGSPTAFRFVELGPGRGTLMADALRATNVLPGFGEAASLHLVETSPALRARQKRTLAAYDPTWHDRFADVPDGPTILVANEFFDALPIHQFERTTGGWRERLVALDGERFVRTLSPTRTPAEVLIPRILHAKAEPRSVVEVSPLSITIMTAIAERVASFGGCALIVDYGHDGHAVGDTLQAVRNHEFQDVLGDPGAVDLTAHVDFAALAEAAHGSASHFGPTTQGAFLQGLGINMRAEQLNKHASETQRRDIDAALRRLIDPEEMGTLFKVMAVCDRDLPPPPGFDPVTGPATSME